ncbi:hypothetical protein ACSQ67_005039 [Phaseolus vulgaris]
MDDTETKQRIEETVRRILQESDMDEVTESKIRKQASEQLGLNLSQPHFKAFVKQVAMPQINFVFGFQLSEKRRVTIQDFRGKTLVSIREYYKKDGKDLPTSKGISLTEEQWSAFKKICPP